MEACYSLFLGFLLSGGEIAAGCFSIREYCTRVINLLLWIALIVVTVLLFQKLARLVRLWAAGSKIPGPPSPSFFAGHAKVIAGCSSARHLTGYLSELHEKYGPIVRLWLGPTQLLVSVKDVGVVKEMLIKARDKLPLTERAFCLAFGRSNIFVSSFEKVQEGRESLATCLNEKLLDRVDRIPMKVVDCVLGRVESVMSKGILDCKSISQHISFYILGATLFEERFLNWSDATLYEELLLMISKDACFWASYKISPFWRREYWRYQFLCTKLKFLTRDIIQQCGYNCSVSTQADQSTYKAMSSTGKPALNDKNVTFGRIFSGNSSLHDEKKGHPVSNKELFGDILGVMFHGCRTITNLVCSVLTRLVLYPELQIKIFAEIKQVQQRTSKQDSYDVLNMHFLLGTVYESARLLPPGPLLQRCSLNQDLHLKSNITVPAGSILVVPLELVQMDNSIWGDDASQFNPHRFISNLIDQEGMSEENGIPEPDKYAAYLPFGSGSRACIGQKFAILRISALFASLLQNYEIRLMPGSENDLKATVNDHVHLVPNPRIVFVRRNN